LKICGYCDRFFLKVWLLTAFYKLMVKLGIQSSCLKSGRNVCGPIESASRHTVKVIVPFRPSFYYMHHLPDKFVIYSTQPLPSHDIFTFIFYAPINNRIKTAKIAIPTELRFSPCPQVSLMSTSRPVPAPALNRIELLLDRNPDRRWNHSRIPALSLLGCSSLGLFLRAGAEHPYHIKFCMCCNQTRNQISGVLLPGRIFILFGTVRGLWLLAFQR
jgi:hypothetical protein